MNLSANRPSFVLCTYWSLSAMGPERAARGPVGYSARSHTLSAASPALWNRRAVVPFVSQHFFYLRGLRSSPAVMRHAARQARH